MISRGFIPLIMVFGLLAGTGGAVAQGAALDEAVKGDGTIDQKPAFSAAQERAIYNAVIGQRVQISSADIPAAVGAAVPQTVDLAELPDQGATETVNDVPLKYAMVEDNVVVVDPVSMLVVDVIRARAR